MLGQPVMTVLDLQTFAANTLADNEGLSMALKALESCLAGPDISLDLIVQDLCSVPHLFEFIISVLPSARRLVCRILDAYPTDPTFVEGSSASILLRRLSPVLFTLPPDLYSANTLDIEQSKVYVEDALPVLTLLCSANSSSCFAAGAVPTRSLEEYNDGEFSGICMHDKQQKKPKHKNKNATPAMDATPLHKLGKEIPLNGAEAARMACEISCNLKATLKLYLELLLEPSLARRLKDAYVARNEDSVVLQEETEGSDSKPFAYPKVQPVKAALYFENADGFGEWRIIISTDATKKLCELANGDRKKCAIVVKKIKQLSNGNFSGDNQIRLNESAGIPIFEAKIQQGLRLVYQVDVALDCTREVERQVIKIYGVYIHTQLNRIWDAMGQHLAGKGEEYRRRCIFRTSLDGRSDVCRPACFPRESLQIDTKPASLALSHKDSEELHSLLALNKYVTFSKAFLHSLVLNQDVQHVFELAPQEREIVECTTSCYVLGRSGTGKTTTMLFKMLGIQRAWEMQTLDMPKPRQIFVTKSRMLAIKFRGYFMELLKSLALDNYSLEDLKKTQGRSTESGLVDVDDEEQVDIPQKYSALEDNHFPLFVTFEKLSRMIAADVLSGNDPEARRWATFFINTDEVHTPDYFVTYDIFARTYWPRFAQNLTKGLEPWFVFSEFIGVIKGSEKSISCPKGFLDEEVYCGLSARCNPTFANQRRTVYAIFKAYCKLKKKRCHHDAADRTHAILKALLGGTPLEGLKVDYLYIDEAQDNLLIDALLLRFICRNPDGLFWAGDTAQAISSGSSFRFNDLKAFLYRIERNQITHLIQDRSVADPMVFQLATNYRSHGGIVDCAHSVIERITHFWPNAIDVLQPEHGIVHGFRPIFFRGWDQDTFRYAQFLFGTSGSRIEFGAQQCILVRDEEAVQRLRKDVGEIGLIMTLDDSKGLEFNDVLLYNFFEDSAVDASRWSVLLNHLGDEVDGKKSATMHVPSFERNAVRFAGVCSELKLLYVGITRARKNLWIFDTSEKSEPMRLVWTARDQVQNCTPSMDVLHLAVSSAPKEWGSFGHDLFKRKKYPQAMHCFARAEEPRMAAICKAFHLREVARAKVGVASLKVQQDAFLEAADAFFASGNDVPSGKDKLQYYRNAADCYIRAEDDRKAAEAYLGAQEYDLAAWRFRKAGLFEKTLEVLRAHSGSIPSESSEELYTVCRLFYCSERDAVRPRLPLFPSFEEELEFLEEHGLGFARATLLENHGRYVEAAELHLSEKRPLNAVKDFLKEEKSHDAILQATRIILDGLWCRCSFSIGSKDIAADQEVSELLELANNLPINLLDPLDYHEISMFRAVAQGDLASLEELSHAFLDKRSAPALLALDHFFSRLPALKSYTVQQMSLFLDRFLKYARLLFKVVAHPDPLSSNAIKRLFGITEISNTDYSMELGSFLHCSATGNRHGPMYLQPSIIALSKREMITALRKYLAAHLRERVTEENELCCKAVVLSQCLTFIAYDLDSKLYNLRIGIHLQQICILQLMYSVNPTLDRRGCVLDWLARLYEAFKPHSHVQGSTADLDLPMIPGVHEGFNVMKHWVRGALYNLRAEYDPPAFLTNVLKLTSLVFAFDESNALRCIKQAYFNSPHIRVPGLVCLDGRYIVEDIVNLFDGTQPTCISAGLLFLRHSLKSPLYLDISVFCDCLEEVVGKASVSWRLSFSPPLDGLVLPRGWLSSNKDISTKKEIRNALIVDVLDCVQELLVFLQSDGASRIYSLSHTKLTPMLCHIFTSRICRALCLLAYNVRNRDVRLKVKDIFDNLRVAGYTHRLYRKYLQAHENEYLKAIVEYDIDAKVVIEDLVQLLHRQRDPQRVPPLRLPRIQHVHYGDPAEVPLLLASNLVVARSGLRADALAFTLPADPVSQAERIGEERKMQLEEPDVEPAEEAHKELQELAPASSESVLNHEREPTSEEIWAAEKIKSTYRTYRKHREAQTRAIWKGLRAQKNTIFITCLKNVYASGWGRTPYRTIYLWALPRLIVCLEKAISVANEFKKKTRGLLLEGGHERLEEYGKQMAMISVLLKDGHELQKRIEPNAPMHQAKDKDAMKRAVSDVKDFIHRLPTMLAFETQEDLHAAYELIMVNEKQPVSRPERPELNTGNL